MFTRPQLPEGQHFPELPFDHPDWPPLMEALEIAYPPENDTDPLLDLTKHAIRWVEQSPEHVKPWHQEPIETSPRTAQLARAGLIEAIPPATPKHDYVLIDGGNINHYDMRLGGKKTFEEQGLLETPNVVLFGGQRLRSPDKDSYDSLALRAKKAQGTVDRWTEQWLATELARDDTHPNRWVRPFATERQLGRLSLTLLYGDKLRYTGLRMRPRAKELHPSIPTPHVAADTFALGSQRITQLNALAKIREHAGRKKPLDQARPTGRSCFYEWLTLEQPPRGSSVLLLTNAPYIYRSWCDMLLRAAEAGRRDLRITAAGVGPEPNQTVGDILVGLGDLIINFYNLRYEGGVDSPDVEPFTLTD